MAAQLGILQTLRVAQSLPVGWRITFIYSHFMDAKYGPQLCKALGSRKRQPAGTGTDIVSRTNGDPMRSRPAGFALDSGLLVR